MGRLSQAELFDGWARALAQLMTVKPGTKVTTPGELKPLLGGEAKKRANTVSISEFAVRHEENLKMPEGGDSVGQGR